MFEGFILPWGSMRKIYGNGINPHLEAEVDECCAQSTFKPLWTPWLQPRKCCTHSLPIWINILKTVSHGSAQRPLCHTRIPLISHLTQVHRTQADSWPNYHMNGPSPVPERMLAPSAPHQRSSDCLCSLSSPVFQAPIRTTHSLISV